MPDKTIRAIIVDDEDLARERIRQLLRNHRDVEIVAECGNGNEASSAIGRLKPDLVFLDIEMPGLDGFEVLKKVEPQARPLVLFVTAYDQYALRAFEAHACDYLLKPFKRKRFDEAVAWSKSQLKKRNSDDWARRTFTLLEELQSRPKYLDRVAVKEEGRVFFVRVEDINWIEAQDNYVRVHARKGAYLVRQPIRSFEKDLDPKRFVRIHRSAIIHIDRIVELQQWFHRDYRVILQDGTRLPLGRRYREQLRSVLRSQF
jgi:two-component system, LytTR family, response regulator